ncbi:CMGC/GSK protein kinase [Plasmodium falciparum Santa Lucia]|uniref:CMGC/GSK protein kinase n=1 Tax=Plasmodium falciparum Santa Lucia TaxID=478859 RepID=W7FW72_PLAFA|nr:CMGC/GSK protein kinase [Plasmodium falciparum Santa Lucia]
MRYEDINIYEEKNHTNNKNYVNNFEMSDQKDEEEYSHSSNRSEDEDEERTIDNEINRSPNKSYKLGNIIGNGSFGVVYEAICIDTSEQVAIKKVLQDPQYKNRELMIMKNLNHINIIYLKDYYYTESFKKNEKNIFLNVVMEYIPQTVHKYMKYYSRNNQALPMFLVKLYSYQLCRALSYIHSKFICHRDLKPQNLLIDPRTHTLKLCDFGSAKNLLAGQRSVSYICSRFYRAPELMLGSTNYTTHIDLWSLGTPTEDQLKEMNPNYADIKFPDVKSKDLRKVFPKGTPDEAINLITQFLKYEPLKRLNPIEALADPFFDELRDPCIKLPKYIDKLPELFNFCKEEIQEMSMECRRKIIPKNVYEEFLMVDENDNNIINDTISNDFNESNLDTNNSNNKTHVIIES